MATFAKSNYAYNSYAAFRPSYSPALYETVLTFHKGPMNLCVDLGCGHGLVTRALSPRFNSTIGVDPSAGMISTAQSLTPASQYPNIAFRSGKSEKLDFLSDGSVDMMVAGQAAHWFDHPALWPEMKRVVRPGGTLAFWGYDVPVFPSHPAASAVLHRCAYADDPDMLGPYWPQPGSEIARNLYRDIRPPEQDWEVRRLEYEPGLEGPGTGRGEAQGFLEKSMRVGEVKAFVRTWSAWHGWREAHQEQRTRSEGGEGDVVDRAFDEIGWGGEDTVVDVEWGLGLIMARKR